MRKLSLKVRGGSFSCSTAHAELHNQRRSDGQYSNSKNWRNKAEAIGDQACEYGANGVSKVSPEPEDTNTLRALIGMGVVGDSGQKCWIDGGGSNA